MTEEIWTVKRILDWIEGYLLQHGDAHARVSAQWLVSEALGVSRMQLFVDAQRPLTIDERAVLREWTRRRASGEPLQYITGETAFRHITVKVRPGVLIPRPETEVLVSEALALLPTAPKPQDELDATLIRQYMELGGTLAQDQDEEDAASSLASEGYKALDDEEGRYGQVLLVADICTGTGCIACAIASEHPQAQVVATDIAPEAVELARENVVSLGLGRQVEIIECDLGEGIDPSLYGQFDLITSNPPYVPSADLNQIPDEVTDYEPTLALDGGPDGLDAFRRIISWANGALKPGGAVAFELHETCLEHAADIAAALGFADVAIANDLAGRPRVLTARKR